MSDTLERLSSLAGAIDRSYVASLGSIAETMGRTHIAGLDGLVEAMDRSHIAGLGNLAETMMDRSYAASLSNIAKAMDVSPAIRLSDMIERTDMSVRNFDYLPMGCDSETNEWLERNVNGDQEECISDKPSRKKDYTAEGTQVETKTDKDVEQ